MIDRRQKPLRLTEEEARRLEKVCQRGGKSEQSFMQSAVMVAVEKAEADYEQRRDARKQRREERGTLGGLTGAPQGLGIVPRTPKPVDVVAPESPVPAPVVVNVGGAADSKKTERLEWLATWIAAGSDYERETRERTAGEILKASSASREEAKERAAELDALVRAKIKESETGLRRMASVGLEKLREVFG